MTDEGEETRFCTQCGAKLAAGDQFCPYCGAAAVGSAGGGSAPAAAAPGTYAPGRSNSDNANSLRNIGILTVIYAVGALFFGLYCLLGVDAIIAALQSNPDVWNYMLSNYGQESFIRESLAVAGWTMTASGVLAAVATVFLITRKYGRIAFVLVILSAIASYDAVITLIVGIVIAYFIYQNRRGFITW